MTRAAYSIFLHVRCYSLIHHNYHFTSNFSFATLRHRPPVGGFFSKVFTITTTLVTIFFATVRHRPLVGGFL